MSTPETYGPSLGADLIINAPGRSCHGKLGTVVALHLSTDEATVQVRGGARFILPWATLVRYGNQRAEYAHGTRYRYRTGCRCSDCRSASTTYKRAYRERQREEREAMTASITARDRAAYELDQELEAKAVARAEEHMEPCS